MFQRTSVIPNRSRHLQGLHALVTDYDSTLACDGHVAPATARALSQLRAAGWRVVLVTGRRLDDLGRVCHCIECFDFVVAENGALLHQPGDGQTELLAEPPPPGFVTALRARRVDPLDVGRVIVATDASHHHEVADAIAECGAALHMIYNREALMVLPRGVDKASGAHAALRRLRVDPHDAVAVGDAENDLALLQACGCPVALANSIDALKNVAIFVTRSAAGEGVIELVARLLRSGFP